MEARIEEWEFRLAKQQPESDEEGSESSSDHPILADDQHDLSAGADPTTDVPTAESEPLADSHDETILTEERTEKVQAEIESWCWNQQFCAVALAYSETILRILHFFIAVVWCSGWALFRQMKKTGMVEKD